MTSAAAVAPAGDQSEQPVAPGNASQASAGKTTPGIRRWPKLHLIYFLLAFFDFTAVAGGLYLSHQLGNVFVASTEKNTEWSERFVSIWKLGDLALALNAPGNDIFRSRDVSAERQRLEAATERLSAAIDQVREEISNDVPAALASHPIKTLTFVEQAARIMVTHGNRTLDHFEAGDIEQAAASMALMDRSYGTLRQTLNTSIESIRNIQAAYQNRFEGQVIALKRYEYLIGGAIFAMVSFVVMYGHWVGRFISRKYRELEQAHDAAVKAGDEANDFALQVQDVNTEVIRLNKELKENLKALSLAQESALRNTKMAHLGQLTATVAHELRNPLGAVRTSLFLLARKVKGKDLGLEPQMERINNGVSRCDAIITQLLDFAHTKALDLQEADVEDWLVNIVEEQAERLPEAVSIECHLAAGEYRTRFDPMRLSRVIVNLMTNASEAMVGRGDDPSKFSTPRPKIVIRSALTSRGVEISVADNGPGISEENLKRIFEPLFTTKSFGTGLGLPAVEKVLVDHGGGLDVASTVGQGTVFTAWFPAREAEPAAA